MKTYMIFDTETNGVNFPAIYDLGYIIINSKGDILAEDNFAIEEIITDANIMKEAFYHNKVYNTYIPMLAKGDIKLESWNDVILHLNNVMAEYDVNTLAAYNIGFDIRALMATNKRINGEYNNPLWHDYDMLDIWQMACETFMNSRNYKATALYNGWVSEKGNITTNAECAFRYLTDDASFIESHTALDDCMIEKDILLHSLKYKKRLPNNIMNAHPWRIVNS